jgi:adenosylcobinamide-GDP ribazoletransferase
MARSGGEHGAGAGSRIGLHVTGLRLAVSFLTVLPIGPRAQASEAELAASFGMFPLAGFILGAALAFEDLALAPLFGVAIRSALVILTSVTITGALHLDALADTADALGARADRTRALEIMRDSSVGVFGSIAIFFWLGLNWIALANLHGAARGAAIYLVPGLGRWAMVAVAAGMDYLRPAGAGSFIRPEWSRSNLRTASMIGVIAILPVFSSRTRAATAVAITVVLALRWFYRRWLGGVTGDLLGAAGALAEVAAMLALAAHMP